MEKITEVLRELNLSEKESMIYIAMLELDESPAQKISKRANINRVTTYHLLTSLIEKGIVSKRKINNVDNFKAINPEGLLVFLDNKKEKIKSILHELKKRCKIAPKSSSVEIFVGQKGIMSIINKLYSGDEKQFFAYGNFKIAEKLIEYEALTGRKLRIKNKIKLSIITNIKDEKYFEKYAKLTKLKFNKKMDEMTTYTIFGKRKVAIFTFEKELLGFFIENEEIVSSHKFVFAMIEELNAK